MQSPAGDSASYPTSSSAPGNIEQRKRNFHASSQSITTSEVLSQGQKRRLQSKRAIRKLKDRAHKAEIKASETKEYFEEKLSSQKEVYSSVAVRYKSDRDSLHQQNKSLVAQLVAQKSASSPALASELKQTQLQLKTAQLHIEKLERSRRALATETLGRYFESTQP